MIRMPWPRRSHGDASESSGRVSPFTAAEHDAVRRALSAGRVACCPRCATPLQSGWPIGRGPSAYWAVTCAGCRATNHVSVLPGRTRQHRSRARHDRACGLPAPSVVGVRPALLSALVHGAIVAAIVVATATDPSEVEPAYAADTTLTFLAPVYKPVEAEPSPPAAEAQEEPAPAAIPADLGRRGVRVLARQPSLRRATGRPTPVAPRRWGSTVVGDSAAGEGPSLDGDPDDVDQGVTYLMEMLDERPVLVSGPPPRYPRELRGMGVEGSVAIEFVLNTNGRPDILTLRVVETSDARFDPLAIEAVLRSRYRPGRIRGTPVRVMVEQRFTFVRSA